MAIPKDSVIPSGSSQFAKFQDGKNRFRVLSDMVQGFEGWKNKKPFRHEGAECRISDDQVDLNQNGFPNINYFWAMVVWDYSDKQIKVLEITQKTIMKVLKDLEDSADWGDLKNYDIEINKAKVGDKTTYTTLGVPPKPLAPEIAQAYEESDVDLKALFKGDYPMKAKSDDVEASGIPF
jgi:hypothetical protein